MSYDLAAYCCDEGHIQIAFRGPVCPWCSLRVQRDRLQREVEKLRFQVAAAESLDTSPVENTKGASCERHGPYANSPECPLCTSVNNMKTCGKEHSTVSFFGAVCPFCHVIWERDAALDQVANLEFVVAQLEEKVRLLEAAQ